MLRRTIAMLSLLAMPALAAAQGGNGTGNGNGGQQGNMGSMQDTTSGHGAMNRQHASSRSRSSQLGMTHDQVHQLQQALIDNGCLEGQADGIVGPKTRRAIACARQKGNVTGNDPNDLLRSLNLDFTLSSTRGWSSVMNGSGNGNRGNGENGENGSMNNAGRGGNRDSTYDNSGNRGNRGNMRDSSGNRRGNTNGRPRPGNMRDSTRRDSSRTPPR